MPMSKTFNVLLFAFFITPLFADESVTKQDLMVKRVAISFDDAPRPAHGYLSGSERANRLLESLDSSGVQQVAFFAVSDNIDAEGHQRLLTYGNAGHIIANHTHRHPDINQVSLSEYLDNIDVADNVLRAYPNFKTWFRFLYLREGDTVEKRDGVRKYLAEKGYVNAYITLNNYDWYIEQLFQDAVAEKEHIDLPALREFYVQVIMEGINYYDQLALRYLQRSPNHILLLHENDVAALFISDLITELRVQGWEVIPIEEAYQDPLSEYLTDQVLRFNPGRIGEIARDHGQTKQLWHSTLSETYLRDQFNNEVLK